MQDLKDIINRIQNLEIELKEIIDIIENTSYTETHKLKVTKERINAIINQ